MSTLLAVIAHPDDESYSFGGLIALAARAGWECHIECVSSGENGKIDGRSAAPATVRSVRERELAKSCDVLGAGKPHFWRLPDGGLAPLDGASRLRRLLRRWKPDIVLSLGADGAYGHPDHVAVHRWVLAAWQSMRSERPRLLLAAFPRSLFLPQYEKCIAMMGDPPSPPASAIGSDTFDYEVSVKLVESAKLAAVAAHRSQLPGGDPESLFPPGIVAALLGTERFTDAAGADAGTASLLRRLAGGLYE